ncbi:hypothetical protein ACFVT2_12930 [Streptomyces sp. NPDC058000]|uniref:hypothetical protein n=1 Tax=Streptomyces sp. NPDC058000 TaxID=3346299 RepID=UPI0036E0906C
MTTEDFGAPGRSADTDQPHSPARPTPPVAPRALWTRPWAVGLAGLLVGAAAVGVAWLSLADSTSAPTGGGPGRTSTAELPLPTTLGKFVGFQEAAQRSGGRGAGQASQRTAKSDEESTKLLSDAYGGTAAAVRTYAQTDLTTTFMVTAIRGRTPAPFTPYEDPAALGVVRPMHEVRTVGEVSCVIVNQLTPTGQTPRPDSVNVDYCQRTQEGLTVTVRNINGDLRNSPEQIATLVDKVWSDAT